MPIYEEILRLARQLSADERERLARELAPPPQPVMAQFTTLPGRPPAPQSAAWIKAERGHAVLATDTGPAERDIPAGAEAIAGMWADVSGTGAEQP